MTAPGEVELDRRSGSFDLRRHPAGAWKRWALCPVTMFTA